MAVSIQTPEDVVNAALTRIGFKFRIANMFDGSMAAKKSLDIYGQSRDALLRRYNWGFANKYALGVVSGQTAPAPWSVEYNYPTDAIKILNILGAAYLADKTQPLPNQWEVLNDAVAGKTIVCNLSGATLVYTSQVTDPSKWEPQFAEALISDMAKKLSKGFSSIEIAKLEMAEEPAVLAEAEDNVG